jgi:hypothetical protein
MKIKPDKDFYLLSCCLQHSCLVHILEIFNSIDVLDFALGTNMTSRNTVKSAICESSYPKVANSLLAGESISKHLHTTTLIRGRCNTRLV